VTTKHDVIAANRAHPEWTARDIAEHLKCCDGYVNAVKQREGLQIAKFVPNPKAPKKPRRESLLKLGLACRGAGLTIAMLTEIANDRD
jgi:hypothetical protein